MACTVVNRFGQLVLAESLETLPGLFVLRGADLQNEMTARDEIIGGLRDQALENREAAGPSVQGQTRLVIFYAARQTIVVLAGDIGWITDDEIERLAPGDGIKDISCQELYAIRYAMPSGVAGRHSESLRTQVHRGHSSAPMLMRQGHRQVTGPGANIDDSRLGVAFSQRQTLQHNKFAFGPGNEH